MSTLHERSSAGGTGDDDLEGENGSPRTSAGTTATTINSAAALSSAGRAVDSLSAHGTLATSTTTTTTAANAASTVRGQARGVPLPLAASQAEKSAPPPVATPTKGQKGKEGEAEQETEKGKQEEHKQAQQKSTPSRSRVPSAADLSVSTVPGSAVVGALFEQQGYASGRAKG